MVYTLLTSPKVGGFWGAVVCIIGGILAAFSVNRSVAVAASVFATLGFIVAGIAAIVDGIASGIISTLNTCCHATKTTQTCYGHQAASWTATSSYYGGLSYLGYEAYSTNSDLACVDDSVGVGLSSIYFYDGTTDGSKILGDYNKYLKVAYALDITLCIATFVLAIITYMVLCCPQSMDDPVNDPMVPAPAVATAPQYSTVPQPGMVPQTKVDMNLRI